MSWTGGRVPVGVRRGGLLLIVIALLVGAGVRLLPGEEPEVRRTPDPAALASQFGVPGRAWPLVAPGSAQTGLRFVINDAGQQVPCLAFSGGGQGGGGCFRAIGDHGGWALEAQVMETDAGVALYGVAVPETKTVRVGCRPVGVAR